MSRIVFMGTPEFAVPALDAIVAAPGLGQVVGVYTQPDRPVGRGLEVRQSPVKARALAHGLPVFQPEKLSAPGEFEKLSALAPDVIVVVAFGQILKKNVLDLPRLGCVNIHSSLLPRWRGAAPIQWAILAGDYVQPGSVMNEQTHRTVRIVGFAGGLAALIAWWMQTFAANRSFLVRMLFALFIFIARRSDGAMIGQGCDFRQPHGER